MKIAVVGSINVDIIYQVDRMPKQGESLFGREYEILNGGKGANQAVILNSLEDDVVFFGAVGNDVFGESARENIFSLGLSGNVLTKEGNSGLAIIQVANQDNSIVIFKGANNQITKDDIDGFFRDYPDLEYLVTQLEINLDTTLYMIRKAHALGIKVIFNPAPAVPLSKDIVDLVEYLIPNETEAEAIFKTDDLEQIVLENKGKVLITLGSKGVMYYDDGVKLEPAQKIEVVDTTGAGDSFVAGFTSGITRNMSIQDAVKRGIQAASITCTFFGAQSSYQKVKEMK